jgi:hypothetical protein
LFVVGVWALGACAVVFAGEERPDPSACPLHEAHMKARAHAHGVDTRGDEAMGFSHEATTHHFLLRKDGGAIEVTANDPGDEASVNQIRTHLRHITQAFAAGDFTLPGFIHDQVPPGVETMKAQREEIRYTFEERPQGGAVRIRTEDPASRRAIHEFLRFQIADHRTGDPVVP